jgi:hypothetical protein
VPTRLTQGFPWESPIVKDTPRSELIEPRDTSYQGRFTVARDRRLTLTRGTEKSPTRILLPSAELQVAVDHVRGTSVHLYICAPKDLLKPSFPPDLPERDDDEACSRAPISN